MKFFVPIASSRQYFHRILLLSKGLMPLVAELRRYCAAWLISCYGPSGCGRWSLSGRVVERWCSWPRLWRRDSWLSHQHGAQCPRCNMVSVLCALDTLSWYFFPFFYLGFLDIETNNLIILFYALRNVVFGVLSAESSRFGWRGTEAKFLMPQIRCFRALLRCPEHKTVSVSAWLLFRLCLILFV